MPRQMGVLEFLFLLSQDSGLRGLFEEDREAAIRRAEEEGSLHPDAADFLLNDPSGREIRGFLMILPAGPTWQGPTPPPPPGLRPTWIPPDDDEPPPDDDGSDEPPPLRRKSAG